MSAIRHAARDLARPVVRLAREVPVWAEAWRERGGAGAPTAVFLPAQGPRDGSTRLRICGVSSGLRTLGWRTVVLPWTLTLPQRHRLIRAMRPDVLVMQGSRHALNRPELYPGVPVVYDMDDADFHLDHLAEPVRAAMPRVAGVIAGSGYIARWCVAQGAPWASVVWTGTPVGDPPAPQAGRPPVIAWPQTRPMSYTGEAAFVEQVIRGVAARRPGATLRLYDRQTGDDPGFADRFRVPGIDVTWHAACGYADYLASFRDVAVGLAPLDTVSPFSRGKSFGKVLAFLDRGVPVVASAAGEHPAFFTPDTGIVGNDPALWVDAICRLLDNPDRRQQMADAARAAFRSRLSDGAAAARVDRLLRQQIARQTARHAA